MKHKIIVYRSLPCSNVKSRIKLIIDRNAKKGEFIYSVFSNNNYNLNQILLDNESISACNYFTPNLYLREFISIYKKHFKKEADTSYNKRIETYNNIKRYNMPLFKVIVNKIFLNFGNKDSYLCVIVDNFESYKTEHKEIIRDILNFYNRNLYLYLFIKSYSITANNNVQICDNNKIENLLYFFNCNDYEIRDYRKNSINNDTIFYNDYIERNFGVKNAYDIKLKDRTYIKPIELHLFNNQRDLNSFLLNFCESIDQNKEILFLGQHNLSINEIKKFFLNSNKVSYERNKGEKKGFPFLDYDVIDFLYLYENPILINIFLRSFKRKTKIKYELLKLSYREQISMFFIIKIIEKLKTVYSNYNNYSKDKFRDYIKTFEDALVETRFNYSALFETYNYLVNTEENKFYKNLEISTIHSSGNADYVVLTNLEFKNYSDFDKLILLKALSSYRKKIIIASTFSFDKAFLDIIPLNNINITNYQKKLSDFLDVPLIDFAKIETIESLRSISNIDSLHLYIDILDAPYPKKVIRGNCNQSKLYFINANIIKNPEARYLRNFYEKIDYTHNRYILEFNDIKILQNNFFSDENILKALINETNNYFDLRVDLSKVFIKRIDLHRYSMHNNKEDYINSFRAGFIEMKNLCKEIYYYDDKNNLNKYQKGDTLDFNKISVIYYNFYKRSYYGANIKDYNPYFKNDKNANKSCDMFNIKREMRINSEMFSKSFLKEYFNRSDKISIQYLREKVMENKNFLNDLYDTVLNYLSKIK